MEMLERHLNDLFAAIDHCYHNELLMPCLVLLYSGIDVAASLEPSTGGTVGEVRIAFGTDERTELTEAILTDMREGGHRVIVVGDGAPWPDVGRAVGQAVAEGDAERGVVCCWTGTGVSIAANKVEGVRAALCTDAETARGARRWNDANVLALGLRLTSREVAREMIEAFLATGADAEERENVAKLG